MAKTSLLRLKPVPVEQGNWVRGSRGADPFLSSGEATQLFPHLLGPVLITSLVAMGARQFPSHGIQGASSTSQTTLLRVYGLEEAQPWGRFLP